jgi:hypothetical protein
MRSIRLIAAFFLIPFLSFSQTTLPTLLQNLKAEVLEVSDEKTTLGQTLQHDAQKPYKITFTATKTDSKGKQSVDQWEFNLADMDKNTVRQENTKTEMRVVLKAVRGQKFIKHLRNGELEGYTDDLKIQAKNVDNARSLEKLLEEAIPLAQEAWERDADLKAKTPAALLQQAFSLVGPVETGNTTYKQKLEAAGDLPDRVRLTVEEHGSKGLVKSETYTFSLGDLSEPALQLKMQQKQVVLEAGAKRGLRWIGYAKEGGPAGFNKEVEFRVADPDQGKLLLAVLQKLIPYGEEEIRRRLPKAATGADALALLAGAPGKFSVDKNEYEQTLKAGCHSLLSRRKSTEKGTETLEYGFHFGDLNDKTILLDIDAKTIELKVPTLDKARFVHLAKNGEQQAYDNEVVFLLPDLEQARRFEHLLPQAIEQCRQPAAARDLAWLQQALAEGEATQPGLAQKLETQSAGEACKWRFTRLETGEKKSDESVYEFNLYDLDPRQVEIKVSGKKVALEITARYQQKVISHYDNGKPGFVAQFTLQLADIETAKQARETVLKAVEACKK